MKGYNSLKQFVYDYKLYRIAKKADPGRDNGDTVTYFIKKRIDKRLDSASNQFKRMLNKRGYSKEDLMLIATHDSLRDIHNLEFFVMECFGTACVTIAYYKKIISSNAFKMGKLKRLYDFIPIKIESKNDFLMFLKTRRNIQKAELDAIMGMICKGKWREWLNEFIEKGKIQLMNGRWTA